MNRAEVLFLGLWLGWVTGYNLRAWICRRNCKAGVDRLVKLAEGGSANVDNSK